MDISIACTRVGLQVKLLALRPLLQTRYHDSRVSNILRCIRCGTLAGNIRCGTLAGNIRCGTLAGNIE